MQKRKRKRSKRTRVPVAKKVTVNFKRVSNNPHYESHETDADVDGDDLSMEQWAREIAWE